MSNKIAKQGDEVIALDTHIVLVSTPSGPVPTPMPSTFRGPLSANLSPNVYVDEKPVATVDSKAHNAQPHVPQGGVFQTPPSNEATVIRGSGSVFIDEKPAARHGDIVTTCNDPADQPIGKVVAGGTVIVGD